MSDTPIAVLLLNLGTPDWQGIGIRAKTQWRSLSGEDLLLVPALNPEPAWIDAVVQMVPST